MYKGALERNIRKRRAGFWAGTVALLFALGTFTACKSTEEL